MNEAPPSRELFTKALRYVPTAVCIVTSYVDERPWGLTVSAFASVSADPPTILVCVNRATRTCWSIERSGVFGVSFLAEDQSAVAENGATPGVPKFFEAHTSDADAGWSTDWGMSVGSVESQTARQFYLSTDSASSPAVHGAYLHLNCALDRVVDAGTHAIAIGRVESVGDCGATGRPLLYHDRGFHALGPRLAGRVPVGTAPPATEGAPSWK
jgi:flavin reductase (DIM6/NTAB) family NADH-FMN oxidoreductase RutF